MTSVWRKSAENMRSVENNFTENVKDFLNRHEHNSVL